MALCFQKFTACYCANRKIRQTSQGFNSRDPARALCQLMDRRLICLGPVFGIANGQTSFSRIRSSRARLVHVALLRKAPGLAAPVLPFVHLIYVTGAVFLPSFSLPLPYSPIRGRQASDLNECEIVTTHTHTHKRSPLCPALLYHRPSMAPAGPQQPRLSISLPRLGGTTDESMMINP